MKYLIALLIFSCSMINRDSQRYYKKKHGHVPHGFIRVELRADQLKISSSSLKKGRNLYEKHCLQCHGRSGRGDGPRSGVFLGSVANLQDLVKKEGKNFKFYIKISQNKKTMPGWVKDFTPEELADISSYLRTF